MTTNEEPELKALTGEAVASAATELKALADEAVAFAATALDITKNLAEQVTTQLTVSQFVEQALWSENTRLQKIVAEQNDMLKAIRKNQ